MFCIVSCSVWTPGIVAAAFATANENQYQQQQKERETGKRSGALFRGVTVRNRYYDPDVFEVKKLTVSISILECLSRFVFPQRFPEKKCLSVCAKRTD